MFFNIPPKNVKKKIRKTEEAKFAKQTTIWFTAMNKQMVLN